VKKLFEGTMELVTPCCCSGADQAKAEIRAPSIRGELRWWFRALGGTREQEAEVFGAVQPKALASVLIVRTSSMKKSSQESPAIPANHRFFAKSRLDLGNEAFLPAGRTFRLQVVLRKEVSCSELLDLTIHAFLLLGALGLRSNRGLGAVQAVEDAGEMQALEAELAKRQIDLFRLSPQQSAYDALVILEEQLKEFREQSGIPKNEANALGFVHGGKRHASCLRVRPVRQSDGTYLPLMIYTEAAMGENIEGIRPQLKARFA
jgi:CRISPR type III-B/RAMP module RAMP protein Cmr1